MDLSKIKNNKFISKIFYSNNQEKQHKGKVKAFFSQLSRGLMLPIAILPIAGLLLGIGGAIGANVHTEAGTVFANIFKGMSEVVFANLPLLFCIAIGITFTKDKGTAAFAAALGFLVFASSQLAFMQFERINGNVQVVSVLWFHKELRGMITSTLGMPTLQTSIFGGIIVGGISALIYNKFSKVKLPTALDFFSGVRLVPFILIPAMFALSLTFLLFWPWVGQAINFMGRGIQGAKYGAGGLLYGMLGRALMPFGLHHIPIVLAFQTDFGGVLSGDALKNALISNGILEGTSSFDAIANAWQTFTKTNSPFESTIVGDQNIWNFINSLPMNTLSNLTGTQIPVFEWFNSTMGVYAGRFTQDYPTYLGACMGIGAALIYASERKNRRNVSIIIGSAMLVSFLTGITEPLEFSFLFAAPLLYYVLYVPMSGLSYMFMELAQAHVGVGFARGFIDLIIYGAIPIAKGTNFWWAFIIAIGEALVMFGSFYFFIKKFDIATPGRKDNPMSLMTKKQYQEQKQSSGNKSEERIDNIIDYLGGFDNLEDVSACATRLRVSVKDISLVQKDMFNQTGSKGIILKEKSLQVIYGGEASIIADKINEILSEIQEQNN